MSLWEDVKKMGQKAGKAATVAANKAKLKTEMLLLDNRCVSRKQAFGIDLYDHLIKLHETNPEMIMMETGIMENVQVSFIKALKDTKALEAKKKVKTAELQENQSARAAAFPVPAEDWQGKVRNAGKSASLYGGESKIRTEMSLIESQLKRRKQEFGMEVYDIFVSFEDTQNWLPRDRDVRYLYDQTRRDITKLEDEKDQKASDLAVLGSETTSSGNNIGGYYP